MAENKKEILETEVPIEALYNEEPTEQVNDEVINEEQKREKVRVNLADLKIVDRGPIDKEKDLRAALYANKSAFQVVAAQSGYLAKVTPLVHKDTVNLMYSTLSRYEYKKAVFKVVYDKIMAFSIGKVDFEEWLKITSIEDLETFYYGIYCSTFPKDGTITMTCPNCGNEETYNISNGNLVRTTDNQKMKMLINEVSKNVRDREEMKKYSLIGPDKNEAFVLPESKIVVELRTPTLWDSLEILRVVPEKVIDKDNVSVTNMLYINRILIPALNGTYSEETKREEILRLIDNLSITDAAELQDIVYDRVDENRITYSVKNIKCRNCGYEIKELPISIEDTLFQQIFERGQ